MTVYMSRVFHRKIDNRFVALTLFWFDLVSCTDTQTHTHTSHSVHSIFISLVTRVLFDLHRMDLGVVAITV